MWQVIACRGKGGVITEGCSIEDLIRCFLHDSFDSKFVYIISPWITNFEFSKPFVHYPWVSSFRVLDVIRALIDKVGEVKVLTRCFDDAVRFDLLDLVSKVVNQSGNVDEYVRGFIKSQLQDLLDGINAVLSLRDALHDFLLFDLGVNELRDGLRRRLHTKLYINDKYALLGSANFTNSGVVDSFGWGNWECLMLIRRDRDENTYSGLLHVAEDYLKSARGFDDCRKRFVSILRRFPNLLPWPISDVEDVVDVLEKLIEEL